MFIGFVRVAGWISLAYGLWILPKVYFDPDAPSYMLPAVAAVATVPFIASVLAFGGYVQHIHILLPNAARHSKDDLRRFARRIPWDTRLQIKCMWFRPWPVTRTVWFEDLRRLPPSQVRLTNLEHVPLGIRKKMEKSRWGWLVKVFMGRYYVNRSQITDKSRAPGVWDAVWEQIPVVGEEGKKRVGARKGEALPYAISNRAGASMNRSAPPTVRGGPPPPRPLQR